MNDPYEVLSLAKDADEGTIRRRYLELVREFPPDRAPERFAAIRAAYEEIRDPARRLEAEIFEDSTTDSIEDLAANLRARLLANRMPLSALLELADLP